MLSLDFELHWGVRNSQRPNGPYRPHLIGARQVVPRLLELFERYEVGATWATVGFLFARSRSELERFAPRVRPQYTDPNHNPYAEPLGETEEDDPLHFASSLIHRIARCPRQEIATHTFSHYYCLERGHDPFSFAADLDAALGIAAAHSIPIRSIVFPRNQVTPAYTSVLLKRGIECYRGSAQGWPYRERSRADDRSPLLRTARLLDTYVDCSGANTVAWEDVLEPSGLSNVRASRFLRPYSRVLGSLEKLRLRRLTSSLESAATQKRIYHLWWHPHNFGVNPEENLELLTSVLEVFRRCRQRYGMQALSMWEASQMARQTSVASRTATSSLA